MPRARAALLPRLTLAAICALGALAACESATAPDVPRNAVSLALQPFPEPVARYLYTGLSDRRRLVVHDADVWAQVWGEVTGRIQPPPPVPAVDFAAEMVVVASMGTRSTGGFSIEIERVAEADGRLYVVVREVSPGPNCIVTQAFTAPMTAVRVPRRDLPVEFVERAVTRDCS